MFGHRLRNPWRWSFDALTGSLIIADVGQYSWEEVDIQKTGRIGGQNYGWRCYEGNHAFNTSGCKPQSAYTFPDYEEMCRFHQTSPESHFTKNLICSRATTDGRITLSGMRFITTSGPQRARDERTLASREEYDRILRDEFGVMMKNPVRFE